VTAAEADVKKQYRKKSLMIHPDKFKHDDGPEVGLSPSLYSSADRAILFCE